MEPEKRNAAPGRRGGGSDPFLTGRDKNENSNAAHKGQVLTIAQDANLWPVARRVHTLGPRVQLEILSEIAIKTNSALLVEETLRKYAGRLDMETIHALGAHRFPYSGPVEIRT